MHTGVVPVRDDGQLWPTQPRSNYYLPVSVFLGSNARHVCPRRFHMANDRPNGQRLRVGLTTHHLGALFALTYFDAHLCAQLRIICCVAVHSPTRKTQLTSGYRDPEPGREINPEARAYLWLYSARETFVMQGM